MSRTTNSGISVAVVIGIAAAVALSKRGNADTGGATWDDFTWPDDNAGGGGSTPTPTPPPPTPPAPDESQEAQIESMQKALNAVRDAVRRVDSSIEPFPRVTGCSGGRLDDDGISGPCTNDALNRVTGWFRTIVRTTPVVTASVEIRAMRAWIDAIDGRSYSSAVGTQLENAATWSRSQLGGLVATAIRASGGTA